MSLVSRSIGLLASFALAGLVHAADFKIMTSSQEDGHMAASQFANTMGCQGGNQSPQVAWEGAPEGTKSFIVTLYDPDAPTGSGWWHWVVANIPSSVTELPASAGNDTAKLPAGALSINNDMGRPGYFGICPPAGRTHRYTLTVHALKVEKLELPPTATPAYVGFMAYMNGLGKASITLPSAR